MAASEKVRELKILIDGLENPSTREFLTAPHLPGGIPRGAIVELLGPHKTEWLLQFLKQNSELRIFWAEKNQHILPTAIHQRGVDLKRITFATLGADLVTPLRRVLQSQLYPVVIAPNEFHELTVFKALQLFTEKANSVLFLLGKQQPSVAWPISMQIEIHQTGTEPPGSAPLFRVEILKQRGSSHP